MPRQQILPHGLATLTQARIEQLPRGGGQEQQPQGVSVTYQEREVDDEGQSEEEEEQVRDRVLREMEGDMFNFEADLEAEEDG